MRKPTCFIAMAFSKDDTDQLYDEQIKPVLDKLGIKAIIINRVESNDDLNIQIIEQLEKCGFCIADLTYTRPSVYFEAGFAQRAVEVIYTVRKDHLGKEQPDDRRVHFDLQMKPLLTWTSPNDPNFSNKLTKRIRNTFLQGWEKNQKEKQEEKEAIEIFESIPLKDRLFILQEYTIRKIVEIGYSDWNLTKQSPFPLTQDEIQSGWYDQVFTYKRGRNRLRFISIQANKSLLKRETEIFRILYEPSSTWGRFGYSQSKTKKELFINHIFLSTSKITKNRIETVLPEIKPETQGEHYIEEGSFYNKEFGEIMIDYKISWIFLTGIKSIPDLKQKVAKLPKLLVQ